MRLCIVDDGTLTARALVERLPVLLAGLPVEIDVLHSGAGAGAPAGEVEGIREFYGSPRELTSGLHGVDILVVHKAPVSREVIAAAGRLRLIACARAHPVNVDVAAAAARGIPVVHAPGRAAASTADLTLALILCLARNLGEARDLVKSAGAAAWSYECRSALEGLELAGTTLGIIGFGRVGRLVAERAKAFGMTVIAHSPRVGEGEIRAAGAEPVSLEELLARADFVSLHTRPGTGKGALIGEAQLSLMKRTACLVNTARGDLVDEGALYRVLKEGRIRGAALDVLKEEPPPPDHPFFSLPNVILTPHLGGKTTAVPRRAAEAVAGEIANFLSGRPLVHVFSPPAEEQVGVDDG
ncbi:NAD(P)-dependent oxidoreductase [Desulfovirgula thermocuniculi]|uniref:NAD(P)-dependent oxidoreductase n=1 Tax=Desulfovirgula thermocuniculi TaxID=348842 RepID=UPI000427103B|nr:NAD(P)-dependent oxidoreductase [Desulfovirgula thermocuniculi]